MGRLVSKIDILFFFKKHLTLVRKKTQQYKYLVHWWQYSTRPMTMLRDYLVSMGTVSSVFSETACFKHPQNTTACPANPETSKYLHFGGQYSWKLHCLLAEWGAYTSDFDHERCPFLERWVNTQQCGVCQWLMVGSGSGGFFLGMCWWKTLGLEIDTAMTDVEWEPDHLYTVETRRSFAAWIKTAQSETFCATAESKGHLCPSCASPDRIAHC